MEKKRGFKCSELSSLVFWDSMVLTKPSTQTLSILISISVIYLSLKIDRIFELGFLSPMFDCGIWWTLRRRRGGTRGRLVRSMFFMGGPKVIWKWDSDGVAAGVDGGFGWFGEWLWVDLVLYHLSASRWGFSGNYLQNPNFLLLF